MIRKKPLKLNKDGTIKITETMIRGQINQYLRQMGIFYWYNLQGFGCYRGLPDIEGVIKGRHFYIEVKRPGGKQSVEQEVFQKAVEKEGEMYLLVNNLDTVVEKFNPILGFKVYKQQ